MWLSLCPVSLHHIFAVCFDRALCGESKKKKEKDFEKAMETLSDCQDCIHFPLKVFRVMQWDCYWVSLTGKPQVRVYTHTHTRTLVGETGHDRHSKPPKGFLFRLFRCHCLKSYSNHGQARCKLCGSTYVFNSTKPRI